MNKISFDKEMYLGIPLIDKQHEEYLKRMNHFLDSYHQDDLNEEAMREEISFIISYAIEHFDAEEALMKHTDFPLSKQHIAQHDFFKQSTDSFADVKYNEENIRKLLRLLIDWFIAHIKTQDSKLAKHLKKVQADKLSSES